MFRRALIASAFALPATAAVAQLLVPSPSSPQTQLLNALGGAGHEQFLQQAPITDLYVIEASRVLLAGSTHRDIRAFAEQLIAERTANTSELRSLPDAAGRNPPVLDQRHVSLLNRLREAQGDLLNRTFVEHIADASDEAIILYRTFSEGRATSPLGAFAARQLQMLERQRAQARAFQIPA